jgi:hypothetical protein
MTKLNSTIYNKLLVQAQEAKEQGFTKLASNILEIIGDEPQEEQSEYSYGELQNDIHKDLWSVATRLMTYYDVDSADAMKIDDTIIVWASKITDDLENVMNIDPKTIGPLEPKIFGED